MHLARVIGLTIVNICILAAACGGATKVYVAVSQPPEVPLPDSVKRIAVVEFATKDSQSHAYGGIAAARLNSLLASAPGSKFELIDRTHLKGVLAEQDLGASGVTDSSTAIKTGKLLNADAIVFGTVHVETSTDTVEKPTVNVNGYIPGVGSKNTVRRSAVVNVTFNMVEPETGKVLATRSVSRSYDSEKAGGNKGLKKLVSGGGAPASTESVVNNLIEDCVDEFGGRVAVHVDVYEFELMTPRGSKAGNTFAEGGDFAGAAKQYELATKADAKDHAAFYDLAIMKLMLNEPKVALDMLDQVIAMKTDKKYIQTRQRLAEVLKNTTEAQFRPATTGEIGRFKAGADLKE
jgi:curli biogenesis system outer membrane secretion channel CsgG